MLSVACLKVQMQFEDIKSSHAAYEKRLTCQDHVDRDLQLRFLLFKKGFAALNSWDQVRDFLQQNKNLLTNDSKVLENVRVEAELDPDD